MKTGRLLCVAWAHKLKHVPMHGKRRSLAGAARWGYFVLGGGVLAIGVDMRAGGVCAGRAGRTGRPLVKSGRPARSVGAARAVRVRVEEKWVPQVAACGVFVGPGTVLTPVAQ